MIHLYSLTKFQSAFGIKKEIATERSLEKLLKQTRYFTALAISGKILEKLLSNLYKSNYRIKQNMKQHGCVKIKLCQSKIAWWNSIKTSARAAYAVQEKNN